MSDIMPTGSTSDKPKVRRSRKGCHNCKNLKVKCDESKPICSMCLKSGAKCDYSIKLQWGGRPAKKRRDYQSMMIGQHSFEDGNQIASPANDGIAVGPRVDPNFVTLSSESPVTSWKRLRTDDCVYTDHGLQQVKEYQNSFDANGQASMVAIDSSNHRSYANTSATDAVSLVGYSHGPNLDTESTSSLPFDLQSFDEKLSVDSDSTPSTLFPFREDTDFADYTDDNVITNEYSSALMSDAAYSRTNAMVTLSLKPKRSFFESSSASVDLTSFYNGETLGVDQPSDDWYSSYNNDKSESFFTIPRSLEPLPDLLLQVPKYKELFSFFLTCTANFLVPVPTIYPHNPFRELLPRIAMAKPHLLSLLIAYGAAHHSKVTKQALPNAIIRRLLSRTFDGLTKSLEDSSEAQSDATLATAVMLCSYNIANEVSNSWKTHLQGAKNIVRARGLAQAQETGVLTVTSPAQKASDSSKLDISTNYITDGDHTGRLGLTKSTGRDYSPNTMSYFLLRTLAYIDVIGALCSKSELSLISNHEDASQLWSLPLNSIYHNTNVDGHENDAMEFDLLLGMDLSMIPYYTKVVSLLGRRTQLTAKKRTRPKLNELELLLEEKKIVEEGVALSETMWSSSMSAEAKRREYRLKGNLSGKNLASVSLSFNYAVMIHLYRRVLLVESMSTSVQEVVACLNDIFERDIPLGSEMQSCMAFPTVTAACEVHDDFMRGNYLRRLRDISKFGIGNIETAITLVEESWESIRLWAEIAEERGYDIVLV